jgi:hypothetical protein
MVKRRRRYKQTATLALRLAREANRLRDRANGLAPGPEQTRLLRKIRQTETALRIDAWLASTGAPPPSDPTTLMGERDKRRPSKLSQGSAV